MARTLIVVSILTIVCGIGLLLFWYRYGPDATASPKIVVAPSEIESVDPARRSQPQQVPKRERLQWEAPDAFYQTIIDNNLFRPLDWEPLQSESAYMLLGTAIVTDGSEATAYIQERESGQFHAVTLGDPIGTATVEEIAPKRVTLITEQGDTLTLDFAGFRFLNPRRSRSPSIQRDDRPPQRANRTEKRTAPKDKSRKTSAPEMKPQYGYEGPIEYLRQQAEEIRSERRRMQERLRYLQQR